MTQNSIYPQKIKILRIIARLNVGGPAIHTILLTEGLNGDRFESTLACGSISKDEGDMLYYALQKNISPTLIPELKRELNIKNDWRAFCEIYKLVKVESPDIIHTHTAKAGTLGRLAGILYNLETRLLRPPSARLRKDVKLIHTFHGHVFDSYFSPLKSSLFIFIERVLARFSFKIITVSESVKKELISLKICGENKIRVVPLGFELDKFLSVQSRNNDKLNIGIIGRLVPVKNHRLFLNAIKLFLSIDQKAKEEIRFFIIGDGELRRELEEYVLELNINKYVEFTGWKKDLADVYADLDIVALTSLNEGTPVSLIEAMGSSRAVISTDAGGVIDLLGQAPQDNLHNSEEFKVLTRGVLVKNNDPQAFARGLTLLLKDKELREKLGVSGRNFVRNKFSKDRLINDIKNLYYEILK